MARKPDNKGIKSTVYIWTDGSCDNKVKDNGGCGIVMQYEGNQAEFAIGRFTNTTSARMEIRGLLEALRIVQDKTLPLHIWMDNQYCINSIEKGWAFSWERDGWEGRKNADLWIQVLAEYRKFKSHIKIDWLKGHAKGLFPENELADKLAKEGANKKEFTDDTEKVF